MFILHGLSFLFSFSYIVRVCFGRSCDAAGAPGDNLFCVKHRSFHDLAQISDGIG